MRDVEEHPYDRLQRVRQEDYERWLATDPTEKALKVVGTPERYRPCSFATWEGDVPEAALTWDGGRGLTLWGPTGTGKTHLATAVLARAVIASAATRFYTEWNCLDEYLRWTSARGVLERVKGQFGKDQDSYLDELVAIPETLLVDDLGAELLSGERGEWRRDRLGYLLCERYDRKRPTIITTNLGPEEIGRVDSRLASRLFSEVVVAMKGKDRRLG